MGVVREGKCSRVGGLQNNGPSLFFRFVLPLTPLPPSTTGTFLEFRTKNRQQFFPLIGLLFSPKAAGLVFFALSLWPLLVLYAPAISHFNPFLK